MHGFRLLLVLRLLVGDFQRFGGVGLTLLGGVQNLFGIRLPFPGGLGDVECILILVGLAQLADGLRPLLRVARHADDLRPLGGGSVRVDCLALTRGGLRIVDGFGLLTAGRGYVHVLGPRPGVVGRCHVGGARLLGVGGVRVDRLRHQYRGFNRVVGLVRILPGVYGDVQILRLACGGAGNVHVLGLAGIDPGYHNIPGLLGGGPSHVDDLRRPTHGPARHGDCLRLPRGGAGYAHGFRLLRGVPQHIVRPLPRLPGSGYARRLRVGIGLACAEAEAGHILRLRVGSGHAGSGGRHFRVGGQYARRLHAVTGHVDAEQFHGPRGRRVGVGHGVDDNPAVPVLVLPDVVLSGGNRLSALRVLRRRGFLNRKRSLFGLLPFRLFDFLLLRLRDGVQANRRGADLPHSDIRNRIHSVFPLSLRCCRRA